MIVVKTGIKRGGEGEQLVVGCAVSWQEWR